MWFRIYSELSCAVFYMRNLMLAGQYQQNALNGGKTYQHIFDMNGTPKRTPGSALVQASQCA